MLDALRGGSFYSSAGPEIQELAFDDGAVTVRCTPAASMTILAGRRRIRLLPCRRSRTTPLRPRDGRHTHGQCGREGGECPDAIPSEGHDHPSMSSSGLYSRRVKRSIGRAHRFGRCRRLSAHRA